FKAAKNYRNMKYGTKNLPSIINIFKDLSNFRNLNKIKIEILEENYSLNRAVSQYSRNRSF
ncbi:hypothetical protein ACSYAD_34910, partial [Acaryochloris marina NIES-2412]|uniref:hypothetical protein n=1 Tax=Acaryochloris marina TaxID=155978 RepID=UPI004059FC2D